MTKSRPAGGSAFSRHLAPGDSSAGLVRQLLRLRPIAELFGPVVTDESWKCYAMPCDAMRCYAMRCYAMLCDAMRCYAMLCDAMRCYAMRCYAMLCYAMLAMR
jgi:hypothetical protein